jgi:hypothetical protein
MLEPPRGRQGSGLSTTEAAYGIACRHPIRREDERPGLSNGPVAPYPLELSLHR